MCHTGHSHGVKLLPEKLNYHQMKNDEIEFVSTVLTRLCINYYSNCIIFQNLIERLKSESGTSPHYYGNTNASLS